MTASTLDLSRYLRSGDRVVWGQGCAEPQTLTELLVRQRHRLGGVTCFVGLPAADDRAGTDGHHRAAARNPRVLHRPRLPTGFLIEN